MNAVMICIPPAKIVRRRLKRLISNSRVFFRVFRSVEKLVGRKLGLVAFAQEIADAFSRWLVDISTNMAYKILATLVGDKKLAAHAAPIVEEFLR